MDLFLRQTQAFANLLHRGALVQHVLGGIVVHLANFVDVIVQAGYARFLFGKNSLRFLQSPGEVIAVVVHGVVGILRGVEAAVLAVAEPLVHPANDVAGYGGEELGPVA